MVQVKGSKGFVNIEIEGIGKTLNNIQKDQKRLLVGTDVEMVRVANFVQNEIKESIIGNRAEPKSVETGKFANSIEININRGRRIDTAIIKPKRENYPGTKTTTEEVGNILEYGTSKGLKARRHFRNTKARVERKIVNDFKDVVKIALR